MNFNKYQQIIESYVINICSFCQKTIVQCSWPGTDEMEEAYC